MNADEFKKILLKSIEDKLKDEYIFYPDAGDRITIKYGCTFHKEE